MLVFVLVREHLRRKSRIDCLLYIVEDLAHLAVTPKIPLKNETSSVRRRGNLCRSGGTLQRTRRLVLGPRLL